MHHKFIIVSFIHKFFACFKGFLLKCLIGGQTCAFSEPVHLKSAHGKDCLTAPDN